MLTLYTYWRSSAAYRVRIALNLKGLPYASVPKHLLRDGGEQKRADYLALNPQGLVPALADDGFVVPQSLAICEYLEEIHPEPRLLPGSARDRATVRGMALAIACDIHPLDNTRVLQYLERELHVDQAGRDEWYRHWIREGFRAIDAQLSERSGPYCAGHTPTIADIYLVPQVFNARRLDVDLAPYPRIRAIFDACMQLPAFADAQPSRQPDAE